jgi:hypothetical protein
MSTQRDLAIENLALRQQLAVLKHRHPQPSLTDADRLFWVVLSGIWSGWRESLQIVQPIEKGRVVELKRVGGLQDLYARTAA